MGIKLRQFRWISTLSALALVGLAVACGTTDPASDPTATSSPGGTETATAVPTSASTAAPGSGKYGGILHYGMGPNAEHLFYVAYSGGAGAAWAMTVGDPLTAYGPDGSWDEDKSMAESFDVSQDGTSVTFNLRQGVKFHDGTDFNAEAMKFSLDWALNPENPVIYASVINAISEVEVVDEYTLAVHMDRPFSPIITNLGMNVGMPFSPTAFAERGLDGFYNRPVGTGPFMVTDWVAGSHAVFSKFEDYWREGAPYLDAWRWEEIPNDAVRAASFRNGSLDLVTVAPSALDAIAEARNVNGVQEFLGFAGPRLDHFNAARAPFDDIRVRQAAQMAMDRHGWNQAMTGGFGYPYRGSVLPPSHGAAFEVAEEDFPYPYNPERARELLEEYAAEKGLSLPLSTLGEFKCTEEQKEQGCQDLPAGQPITIIVASSPANTQRAELSQAYYEAVGFRVQVVIGGGDEATKTFVTKEAGFSLRGFGLRPHPSGSLDNYFGTGGSLNAGGWSQDPAQVEMDRLVKEAAATYDLDEQNRLYQEAQKIYMEAALGGVKTATEPTYHFAQPWVKMDKDINVWLKFASDESVKVYDVWLDR